MYPTGAATQGRRASRRVSGEPAQGIAACEEAVMLRQVVLNPKLVQVNYISEPLLNRWQD